MVTQAQYAAVVEHFLEELSNHFLARGEHFARHADVRTRILELSAYWGDVETSDGDRLCGAAALARLSVEVHWETLVAEAYSDFDAVQRHIDTSP